MNPRLLALLAGVMTVSGGVAVFTYGSASTVFVDLQDAGIANDCNNSLIVCHERVGPRLAARLADAGTPLAPGKKYARIVRQAQTCADGGIFVAGFDKYLLPGAAPTDDNDGTPVEPTRCVPKPCSFVTGMCGHGPRNVTLSVDAPDCVRAPLDGGLTCLRDLGDGDGGKYFGRGNVFPVSQAAGSNCEPVGCSVFYGDDPDVTL
jgi:hypothetical protein